MATEQDEPPSIKSPEAQAEAASHCLKTELGIEVPTPVEEPTAQGHIVPLLDKLTYGAPQLVTMAATFLLNVYGNRFYSLLGAPLSALAFYTALARSLDCLTDPVMGWWSDSTRSPNGRRRPYIAAGCGAYAIAFVLLLSPPDFGDQETGGGYTSAWFGVFYILFYLCDTLSNIPYFAWGPELTPDYLERNRVFFVAKIFYFFGMLISAMAPPLVYGWFRTAEQGQQPCSNVWDLDADALRSQPLEGQKVGCNVVLEDGYCFELDSHWYEAQVELIQDACRAQPGTTQYPCDNYSYSPIGGQRWSFTIVVRRGHGRGELAQALFFGLWYVLSMVNLVRRMREKPLEGLNDPVRAALGRLSTGQVPLLPAIIRSLKNIAFQPLIIGWALDAISLTALGTLFPFFIEYVIKPNGEVAKSNGFALTVEMALGFCMLALLLSALVSMPLWLFMSRHFGKYNCFTAFNLVNAVTVFLFYFASEGDVKFIIFVSLLSGIPVGGQFLTDSILADTIDYDEFLNGTRSEGSYTVFATLIPKFVSIPSSAVPLALLAVLGFRMPVNGVAAVQPSSVETFIRMTFVFVPFVCCCVSFVVKLYFPIKTKDISDAISAGIQLHADGVSALDPITGEGRMIHVIKLSEENTNALWKYEYYSFKGLALFLLQGYRPLMVQMRKLSLFCYFAFTVGLTLAISLYPQLSNAGVSIIPVISIIVVGISLTGCIVNTVRWYSAASLGKQPPEQAKHERALVRQLIKAKGIGLGVDDTQSLSAQISQRMSVRALQSSNGFHMAMAVVLIAYGSATIYWYPDAWFGVASVVCGTVGLSIAIWGYVCVNKKWQLGMMLHFIGVTGTLTAVFVVCMLCFIFQNKLKTYVLYNPEEFLGYFPGDFCSSSESFAQMNLSQRRSCANKLSDKCFEIIATVGIFCLVAVIVGLLTVMTEYQLVNSEKLVTPLTLLFSVLIGSFNVLVLVYSVDIITDFPQMMGLTIDGLQFQSVVITAIVSAGVVLILSIFTMSVILIIHVRSRGIQLRDVSPLRDTQRESAVKRLTIAITLQLTALALLIAVSAVTLSLAGSMEGYVDNNFDRGDHISNKLRDTFCNRDSTSHYSLSCSATNTTGSLKYYEDDQETPLQDECLYRSNCVDKLVSMVIASASAIGFFTCCEMIYTAGIVMWLFKFLRKIKGGGEEEAVQLASLHAEYLEEVPAAPPPEPRAQGQEDAIAQEEGVQPNGSAGENGPQARLQEAVSREHYMQAATIKEELDKCRLVCEGKYTMSPAGRMQRVHGNPFETPPVNKPKEDGAAGPTVEMIEETSPLARDAHKRNSSEATHDDME